MKIDPSTPGITGIPKPEHPPAKTESKPSAHSLKDSVSLSELSAHLRTLQADLAEVPVVDHARVEAIKQAIAAGQYTADAGKIADGLIASATELLGIVK